MTASMAPSHTSAAKSLRVEEVEKMLTEQSGIETIEATPLVSAIESSNTENMPKGIK